MDEKPFESMNMVPFIDIMLVLLTIVLMTSSFIVSGKIPVNLPQATASAPDRSEQRTIELDAEGTIYLDSQPLTTEALGRTIEEEDRETAFLLRADQAVSLQHFVDVVDVLKQLGFGKVAVQTESGGR
ncbi:ExbD/TolR family protein [Stutzerimonas tarimensis]|uniref:ExbD/TolR family protein n=1 Tax=Stutzerimonas tarimensis TaxID=1507735 RepID=A0ABV7TAB0_9GAMM